MQSQALSAAHFSSAEKLSWLQWLMSGQIHLTLRDSGQVYPLDVQAILQHMPCKLTGSQLTIEDVLATFMINLHMCVTALLCLH